MGHVLYRRAVVPRPEPAVSSATPDADDGGRTGEDDGFRLSKWTPGAGERAAAVSHLVGQAGYPLGPPAPPSELRSDAQGGALCHYHRWRITASVNSPVEELPPTSPVRQSR